MIASTPHQTACVSCGQPLSGKFCSQCGEKALTHEDKSISHFFGEFFHVLTHADSKFLKSLKYLFTRPGFLTVEFLAGRRKRYTNPLSLFLIANLIYLFITPVDALNSQYSTQYYQVYSPMVAAQSQQKMADKNWTKEELGKRYNAQSAKVSKLLLILMVFLFSVPLAVIFYNRKVYYFDHLVLATEVVNYLIYVVLFFLPIVLSVVLYLVHLAFDTDVYFRANTNWANFALLAVLWAYLALAGKRVYRQRWAIVIPKALLLSLSIFVVMSAYRFILFQVTMSLL